MPAESLKCPQCGGGLELKPAGQPAECQYCGSHSTVPPNAARPMTPDEMQGEMQQTKAQLDQMLGAVAPGAKIFGQVFAFIAIAIFVVAAVLIASIFMKMLRHF